MQFFLCKLSISYQYITAFVGYIIMIVIGTLQGWTAPSLPQLLDPNSPIKFTSSDGSWLAILAFIGSPIGAIIAAILTDRIGRKPCMLIVSPLNFIAWILIAFAQTKYTLFGSRILSGIGDGIMFSTLPMYLAEVTHFKIRGMLTCNIMVAISLGMLLVSIIGAIVSFRTTALIFSILPLFHLLLLVFMPESPYYLIMKDQQEDATKSLRQLRGYQDVSEELERISESVKTNCLRKSNILDLIMVKSNRRACYIVLILRFLQEFSGQLAITFYITIIFNESGSPLSSGTCTSIYFGVQVICSIVSALLTDRIGRKPLLILSSLGTSICLAILGGYFYLKSMPSLNLSSFTWVPLVVVIAYDVLFSLGMSTIPTALLSELFPTSVKAVALCLANIYFGLMVCLATKFFQITTDHFGMSTPFFVFSVSSAFVAVYVLYFLPETKGKTLEEIQEDFKQD